MILAIDGDTIGSKVILQVPQPDESIIISEQL
jgi:hypothetical protein